MKTDKVIYHTKSQQEYDWLMQKLGKAGCKWSSGQEPTKHIKNYWCISKENTLVFVNNRVLTCSTIKIYNGRRKNLKDEFIEVSNIMPSCKDTKGKPKLSLVPPQILFDIAEVREYGNQKYPNGGKDNWKRVDINDYKDALLRHTLKYLQDPKGKDSESGIEHYKHMACNIAFICEMENEKEEQL